MLKGIKYVVETNSEEDRVELREYIFSRIKSASVTNENEHQLIAIFTGDVWMLSTVTEDTVSRLRNITRFKSVEKFIKHCEDNQILPSPKC